MPSFDINSQEIWPNPNSRPLNLTKFGIQLLMKDRTTQESDQPAVDIKKFMDKSEAFPIEFGTNTCRVKSQPKERHPVIAKQIGTAYPVIHEQVLGLFLQFLEHKCKYGNPVELKVYKEMSLIQFVQRLLSKRCVAFLGHGDYYVLLDGKKGNGGFTNIGTEKETPPLTLENLISYDEMKLSAFLSVSTYSDFINDGNRKNSGKIELDKSKITQSGVVIGLIGPRFQMPDYMDCEDILVTKTQNTKENGYGPKGKNIASAKGQLRKIWNDFYEDEDFLYNEVKKYEGPRFLKKLMSAQTRQKIFFDNNVMKKRYAISFDTLLLETESRAAAAGRQAYLHVVGIGLGVWRAVDHQEELFLDTFAQRLKVLLPKLKHIDVVHFAYFKLTDHADLKNGAFFNCGSHPNGGVKILNYIRNPSEKLPEKYSDCLLVVSFAWDSNALPGNEFWEKCLSNSSDSAQASSSLITELMNPHINTEMVNGKNLHIATQNYGVLHIDDYRKDILKLF